ncbi:hypothetical protein C942_02489 [Photobacterium marinum]|uniref:Uncharacterized protein n=1 Tax=Photobacterium marinum TaxID=1056511 RepID=L8J6H9_9GAMM|nr:hypothetical protein [Photobacterium marinum]ELR64465.1 hypothetical protein C942_02489 [Photobacterium marinum]
MATFPKIDFYPLFDGPSDWEIKEHEQAIKFGLPPLRQLKKTEKINDPCEFLLHTINNYGHSGLIYNYREQILSSLEFRDVKRLTPYLKDIPSTNRYRNIPQRAILSDVNAEIRDFGSYLAENQVLFHGGSTTIDQQIITDRPLSTTLCPQIALWHAENDFLPNRNLTPVIWILTVSQEIKKKAIIFRKAGSNMEHEFEVLLESGVFIKPIKRYFVDCVFGDLEVIESVIS